MLRQRGRVGLVTAALVGLVVGGAHAQDVTTERSASSLIFPKVIADGTRDTIIQLTNARNSMVNEHHFYVDGGPVDFVSPVSLFNTPRGTEIDYHSQHTKQQPTHWVPSLGRIQNPFATPCSPNNNDCN